MLGCKALRSDIVDQEVSSLTFSERHILPSIEKHTDSSVAAEGMTRNSKSNTGCDARRFASAKPKASRRLYVKANVPKHQHLTQKAQCC